MKPLFAISFLVLTSFILYSFVPAESGSTYHIIYVDNSKATSDDGLNDDLFNKLTEEMEGIKDKKDDKLFLFISDGKNFNSTFNRGSVDKILEQTVTKNPQRMPDQQYDAKRIRETLGEKISGYNGNIEFSAYISENLSFKAMDAYSPLFNFLPKELLLYTNSKNLKVSIQYPKLTGRVKEAALLNSLSFFKEADTKNQIVYSVKSY